jgi:hypothetical protein
MNWVACDNTKPLRIGTGPGMLHPVHGDRSWVYGTNKDGEECIVAVFMDRADAELFLVARAVENARLANGGTPQRWRVCGTCGCSYPCPEHPNAMLGLRDQPPNGRIDRRVEHDETKGNGRRDGDVNDVAGMLYRSEF